MAAVCSAIAANDAFRKCSELCAFTFHITHRFLVGFSKMGKLSYIRMKTKWSVFSFKSDSH